MKNKILLCAIKAKTKIVFYTIIKKIKGEKLIIDTTRTLLTPGNKGKDCHGNGEHMNWRGRVIECCCDECDYMMCCMEEHIADIYCPRAKK